MAARIGAQGKAEYQREFQLLGQKVQVAQRQYDVGLLVAGDALGDKIVITQVLLGLL